MVRPFRKTILHLTVPLIFLILWPMVSAAEGIVIGVILPLSGTQAAFGHMQKNSMIMAAEEINARRGIKGRALELDIRDSSGHPRQARAIVDHFARDKQYPVVLGGFLSSEAKALAEKCEQRRIPLVVVTGSDDAVTLQNYRFVFRVSPPRSRYPSAAMNYARSVLRSGKVGLITEQSAYGDAMNWTCGQAAREAGWNIVGQWQFTMGELDVEKMFSQTAALKPDAVFLAAFPPEGIRILARLREKIPDTLLLNLVPSSTMANAYLQCGVSCEGVMNPSLWWPEGNPLAARYRDRYTSRYGQPPDYHGAQAYAAVMAAAQAIGRAGSVQAGSVRDALEDVAVNTPYGKVSFGNWGGFTNQNDPPNYLVRWTGREFELVRPEGR